MSINNSTEKHQPVECVNVGLKIYEIMTLKSKISVLIHKIHETKILCNKYENENKYFKDYIENLLQSNV